MIGITLFQIGNLTVYTHGFFLVMGIMLASFLMYYAAKRGSLPTEHLLDYIVYTVLFGIIGARVAFYLLYSQQFSNFIDLFKIWQGGLVSYGGFITGIIAFVLIVRSSKEKILPWLDILAISLLLGLAVGRFGSFLSGELAGLPSSGIFQVRGLFPVTLAEAFWNLALFVLLSVVYFRNNTKIKPGILTLEVLMLYAIGRFIIEFFRNDSTMVIGLSLSQLVLAVIFVTSIAIFIKLILIERKGAKNAG